VAFASSNTNPERVFWVERKPRVICNDSCSRADKLSNGYHSVLVMVVVAVMPEDYPMAVVAVVVAVMPIWLCKCAGREEHKQDKH
jgi:hypothetical protein